MANVIEGNLIGQGLRVGIIVSRFNELITERMLEGALNEFRRMLVSDVDITVTWVPGAHEIPVACKAHIETSSPDGLVAVGCIIRGETSHHEHISQSVLSGIQQLSILNTIPIGLGVLTVENMVQAIDRAGGKMGNRGRDAARSTVEMIHVLRRLSGEGKKKHAVRDFIETESKK